LNHATDPFGFTKPSTAKRSKPNPPNPGTTNTALTKKSNTSLNKTTKKKSLQEHRRGESETTTKESADLNKSNERNHQSKVVQGEYERSQNITTCI